MPGARLVRGSFGGAHLSQVCARGVPPGAPRCVRTGAAAGDSWPLEGPPAPRAPMQARDQTTMSGPGNGQEFVQECNCNAQGG